MERKYHSNIAFTDLLFNILFGFVILFIIAFLLINPITKKDEVPLKAEFLIIVEWPADLNHDIDTWVRGPNSDLVGFRQKETSYLHLDRDDLGHNNDTIEVAGEIIYNNVNREIVTIRGIVPGDYYVSIHFYSANGPLPVPVTVSVMDVNPYREIYNIQVVLDKKSQEAKFPGFTIDKEGSVIKTWHHSESIVPYKSLELPMPLENDSQ